MNTNAWHIHTDGGARGNPGPAAYAFIIERPGLSAVEDKGFLGETTNNIAEYEALVRALRKAKELGGSRLIVHSDSELMVKQMRGEYKVKHPGLQDLYAQAEELCRDFEDVGFRHVPRESNKQADRLCNRALDAALGKKPVAGPKPKCASKSPGRLDQVRAEMLACLAACIQAWAQGEATAPSAPEILDQLWSILEEATLV